MDTPETTQVLDTGPAPSNYNPIRADHQPPGCEASMGKMTPAFPLLLCLTLMRNLCDIYQIQYLICRFKVQQGKYMWRFGEK